MQDTSMLAARAELWAEYQGELSRLKLAIDVTSGPGCEPSTGQRQAIELQRRVVRVLEAAWLSTWSSHRIGGAS